MLFVPPGYTESNLSTKEILSYIYTCCSVVNNKQNPLGVNFE